MDQRIVNDMAALEETSPLHVHNYPTELGIYRCQVKVDAMRDALDDPEPVNRAQQNVSRAQR